MVVAEKQTQLAHQNSPIFSRHETFPPRNGWLKKAFDAIADDPNVFTRDDAALILGVGKNMAKAIRYWAIAFKIAEEKLDKSVKSKTMIATEFGNRLLSDNGWDPYLEDTASLWLLHWSLLKKPCLASSWAFAFNHFRHPEFTQEDFLNEVSAYAKQTWPDSDFSDATLKNDVSCFVRMYCKDESARHVSEETISSPFSELNLLTKSGGSRHISFHFGGKTTLPDAIVAAASLDYASEISTGQSTINISQLAYSQGSPGQIFKITESILCTALEHVSSHRKDIVISDTGGIVQLAFTRDPLRISEDVLKQFYAPKGR